MRSVYFASNHFQTWGFIFSLKTLSPFTQEFWGTSLVVQWLRSRLPMHGTWDRSLVGELRSHMPWGS